MEEKIFRYAPVLLLFIIFIMQYNLFVTPEKLEQTHRAILTEVRSSFYSKEQGNDLKAQLNMMQTKIDRIYEVIIDGGNK